MIRKHIHLTEELADMILLTAVSEHKTEARVIREVLHAGFARKRPARTAGEALLGLAALGEALHIRSDDPYLSRNIDTYLYEDE